MTILEIAALWRNPSECACLSPDGTILVLLGELNYQVINTLAYVCTT